MGIGVITRLQDGSLAEVDSDVLAIGRRLQEGDATLGWPGDPELSLCFDHDRQEWAVVHRDLTGSPYVVATGPTCDENLVRKVVAADNRLRDVAAEIDRRNAKVDAEYERRHEDFLDNHMVPKLQWAYRRDSGWDTPGHSVLISGGKP